MTFSIRTMIVVTATAALGVSLSLGLSGCKKSRVSELASSSGNTTQGSFSQRAPASAPDSHLDGNAGTSSAESPQDIAHGELQKSNQAPGDQTANSAASTGNNAVNTGAAGAPTTAAGQPGSPSNIIPNGMSPVGGANVASAVPPSPSAPKEPAVTCFLETFKHKPTAGHDSEEACSHHKNLVSLSHPNINPKSVCVRVNNVPTKYERVGSGAEFLIGSIAGPKATITVSYCTGKTSCALAKKDDCAIPKDEFMDAIGGGTDDGSVAQWENTNTDADAKLNNDVKRELADIDDAGTEGHSPQASVFKDWVTDKAVPACGKNSSS